jgi:REP element-mobilizing transposase RayT
VVEQRWRKRIRLPEQAYWDQGSTWHVTISTADRSTKAFVHSALAEAVVAAIIEQCAATGTILHAYCLMPDHCHLILQVTGAGLVETIADLKSRTTRVWWAHGGRGTLWQRSFHDHGLRTPRDFEETVRYLLENPVRAGLVDDWTTYPFSGGLDVSKD